METKSRTLAQRAGSPSPKWHRSYGYPRSRAYELVAQGHLPAVRIGERSIRVNRRELETFLLESRRVVANRKSGGSD